MSVALFRYAHDFRYFVLAASSISTFVPGTLAGIFVFFFFEIVKIRVFSPPIKTIDYRRSV